MSVKAAPPSGQLATIARPPWACGDPFDDRQAQARAAALGREERLEQPVERAASATPGPLSATSISKPARRAAGGEHQLAAVGHGIQGVEHQVEHGPAEHVAVGRSHAARRAVDLERDVLGLELRRERLQTSSSSRGHVERSPLRSRWLEKCSRSLTVASRAVKPAVTLSSTSRLPASSSIRRRSRLRYSFIGTRLLRTSWATCDAIWPRSARRFLRASSRFFASSSSVSRRTSARSASCVCCKRSVASFQACQDRRPGRALARRRGRTPAPGEPWREFENALVRPWFIPRSAGAGCRGARLRTRHRRPGRRLPRLASAQRAAA